MLHVSKRGIFCFGFQNLGETFLGVLSIPSIVYLNLKWCNETRKGVARLVPRSTPGVPGGVGRQILTDLKQRITRSQISCESSLQVPSSAVGPALERSICAQL